MGTLYCIMFVVQDWVRRKHKNIPIEVETRTLEEVKEVLQFLETDRHTLVKRLMLDNMTKLDPSAPGLSAAAEQLPSGLHGMCIYRHRPALRVYGHLLVTLFASACSPSGLWSEAAMYVSHRVIVSTANASYTSVCACYTVGCNLDSMLMLVIKLSAHAFTMKGCGVLYA